MKLIRNDIAHNNKKELSFLRSYRPKTYIAGAFLLLFLIGGCAVHHQNYRNSVDPSKNSSEDIRQAFIEKTSALRDDLAKLDGQVDLTEAGRVAETAITYADDLIAKYNLVRPAAFHNVLVRIGMKDRGLCYHWAEDLMKRLQSLELETLQLYWGVAYRGSELREHNTVIITAKGRAFEHGMVLDPWRNSGDLYWASVKKDSYPWEKRPSSEW